VQVPLVDLKAQYAAIKADVDAAIARVLAHGQFILGEEVTSFEKAFADYIGVKDAAGVASGTAALTLALLACEIGSGDEVVLPAHTFMATAGAVSAVGARPVFVEIDPRTYNLDAGRVEAALTTRTRAVIAVHLYGQPADLDSLSAITKRRGVRLIEDAAQAVGAELSGRRCGSIGDVGCFSFYPGKNLGAYGDAGAVTSNDDQLLARVRRLRDHGRTSKYLHEELGFGERLDALQAAVLNAKLPHLESWTEARRAHAHSYSALLADADVTTPWESPQARHVYHLYVIRARRRDEVLARLQAKGIGAGIHYPVPLHRQPAYRKRGYGSVSLPVTEQAASEVLSLPMYPELREEQVRFVAGAVREAAGGR
jgi:dTDP-4-amino-4,6-dideoxygalactose transaminase